MLVPAIRRRSRRWVRPSPAGVGRANGAAPIAPRVARLTTIPVRTTAATPPTPLLTRVSTPSSGSQRLPRSRQRIESVSFREKWRGDRERDSRVRDGTEIVQKTTRAATSCSIGCCWLPWCSFCRSRHRRRLKAPPINERPVRFAASSSTRAPVSRWSGARVRIENGTLRVTTNDDGRFVLADLDAGPVRLESRWSVTGSRNATSRSSPADRWSDHPADRGHGHLHRGDPRLGGSVSARRARRREPDRDRQRRSPEPPQSARRRSDAGGADAARCRRQR